jgi:hypothetical protein
VKALIEITEGAHQNYENNGIKSLKISEGAHFHEGAHAHTKLVANPSAPLCPAQTPCGGGINLRKEGAQTFRTGLETRPTLTRSQTYLGIFGSGISSNNLATTDSAVIPSA